jgi:hypothetical protein
LQRVFSQFVLAMPTRPGALAGERILLAKQVEERSSFQAQDAIGFALLVN